MRYRNLRAFDLAGTDQGQGLFGWRAEHDTEGEMIIYAHGVVGDEWDGMDSRSMVAQIRGFTGRRIVIDVNTPGGFVFDGLSVYNALIDHEAEIQVDVTGEAWSMGSILAMAGDKVRIGKAAVFGVHEASVGLMAFVNKRGLDELYAEFRPRLAQLDEMLAGVLAERSGQEAAQIEEWMRGEVDGTQWTGQEAVDLGFADELIERRGNSKPAAVKPVNRLQMARKIALTRSRTA